MNIDELKNEIKRRETANSYSPFPVYDTGDIMQLKVKLKKLNTMRNRDENPNNEPITYCKTCLSIAIKTTSVEEHEVDYCSNCGNTDIDQAHISEWSDWYEEKYGHNYLKGKE